MDELRHHVGEVGADEEGQRLHHSHLLRVLRDEGGHQADSGTCKTRGDISPPAIDLVI